MENKSRERKLPIRQMRMYKGIGEAAHCSGWVYGVWPGYHYVYTIYKHTHPDYANYIFGRDRETL